MNCTALRRLSLTISLMLIASCSNTGSMRASIDEGTPSSIEGAIRSHHLATYNDPSFLSLIDNLAQDKRTDALVVFDVDNTLLKQNQFFGSDQWYEWLKQLPHDELATYEPIPNCIFESQGMSFVLGDMSLTEESIVSIVENLIGNGISVIGLTARSYKLRWPTERELSRHDINFSPPTAQNPINELAYVEFFPSKHPCRPESRSCGKDGLVENTRVASYFNGLLMAAGQHKGYLLKEVLKGLDLDEEISTIVFIDDKKKNVDQIIEAFRDTGKDVHAFWYTSVSQYLGVNLGEADKKQAVRDYIALTALRSRFAKDFDSSSRTCDI